MRVVDTHLHFWIQDSSDYPWLTEEWGGIYRDFEPAEVEPQLKLVGVDSAVLVQSANSYKDTEAMLAQATSYAWVAGVVGWVPLLDRAETARKLDEEWMLYPRFCGVRHLNHIESDPAWIVQDAVIESLRELESRSLTYDVLPATPAQFEHVPTLARAREGLRIIIDHLAKPPLGSGDLGTWRDQMSAAGSHPNVFVKVSGLNTSVGKENVVAADLVPVIQHAIDVFGVDRLMFGSDWPVATLGGTYETVWCETLAALDIIGLNEAERTRLYGGTAIEVYGLGGSA